MSDSSKFDQLVVEMPARLEALQSSAPTSSNDLKGLPEAGVYVLYENERPIYVGRSRRLQKRIREHGQRSSGRYSATFAFILALEEANKQGLTFSSPRRAVIESTPEFRPLFEAAKDRVAGMAIRAVKITDPIEQTVFEVYAALALDMPYNRFETH